MAGRMDLIWQGQHITIERSTHGRTPMGEFSAYETKSGVPIPSLTAETCGELLTGVPRSVFARSAFLQQAAHAVSYDADLEQRLHDLVTTGDETVSYARTERQLQELSRRCRRGKTGLIADVEQQLQSLAQQQLQRQAMQQQMQQMQEQLSQLQSDEQALLQQRQQLQKQARQRRSETLTQALQDVQATEQAADNLQQKLAAEPPAELLDDWQLRLETLSQPWQATASDTAPVPPALPAALADLPAEQALQKIRQDLQQYMQPQAPAFPLWAALLPLLLCLPAIFFVLLHQYIPATVCAAAAIAGSLFLVLQRSKQPQKRQHLIAAFCRDYDAASPAELSSTMQKLLGQLQQWQRDQQHAQTVQQDMQTHRTQLRQQKQALLQEIAAFWPDEAPEQLPAHIHQLQEEYRKLNQARQAASQAQQYWQQLQQTLGQGELLPDAAAPLQLKLQQTQSKQQSLQRQLDQLAGRCEALAPAQTLEKRQKQLQDRLEKLQRYHQALELAQQALQQANATLQARFAPQLARRAGAILRTISGGAHDRLDLDRQMALQLYEPNDPTRRAVAYYSQGAQEQMYLALRLAIAELLLLPDTPLVLDDALASFDDTRVKSTLEFLRQQAKSRQILLFTCQSREARLLSPPAQSSV